MRAFGSVLRAQNTRLTSGFDSEKPSSQLQATRDVAPKIAKITESDPPPSLGAGSEGEPKICSKSKWSNKSRAEKQFFNKKIKMFHLQIAIISSEIMFLASVRPGYRSSSFLMPQRDLVTYTLLNPRAPKGYSFAFF